MRRGDAEERAEGGVSGAASVEAEDEFVEGSLEMFSTQAVITDIPRMWTAPSSQGVLQRFDQIACAHMSGLVARSHIERWPRWFPRWEFQTDERPHRGPPANAVFLSSRID